MGGCSPNYLQTSWDDPYRSYRYFLYKPGVPKNQKNSLQMGVVPGTTYKTSWHEPFLQEVLGVFFCFKKSRVIPGTPKNGTPIMVSFPSYSHILTKKICALPKFLARFLGSGSEFPVLDLLNWTGQKNRAEGLGGEEVLPAERFFWVHRLKKTKYSKKGGFYPISSWYITRPKHIF